MQQKKNKQRTSHSMENYTFIHKDIFVPQAVSVPILILLYMKVTWCKFHLVCPCSLTLGSCFLEQFHS